MDNSIRPLFNKYQREILAFVNTIYGRDFLGIKTDSPVVKLTPDSWHALKGFDSKGQPIIQATFYPRSPYLNKFRLAMESMVIAEETGFNFRNLEERQRGFAIPQYLGLIGSRSYLPLIMNLQSTFYPDPDPESTSVDSTINSDGAGGSSWATVRGVTNATSAAPSTTPNFFVVSDLSGGNYYIWRNFMLFDTSSLGSGAVVSAAVCSVKRNDAGGSGYADQDVTSIKIVQTTPASNTNIVVGDWPQFGSTSGASVTLASTTNATYSDFTLSDLSWVIVNGITKLGSMNSRDFDNVAPIGNNQLGCDYAEAASTTSDPKLLVTYTVTIPNKIYQYNQAVNRAATF